MSEQEVALTEEEQVTPFTAGQARLEAEDCDYIAKRLELQATAPIIIRAYRRLAATWRLYADMLERQRSGSEWDAAMLDIVAVRIEHEYAHTQLGSGAVGGTFGEILCHELHMGDDPKPAGLHFVALAEKWRVPVTMLGALIALHCERLVERQPFPTVSDEVVEPRE
jgi:hypothetical protein